MQSLFGDKNSVQFPRATPGLAYIDSGVNRKTLLSKEIAYVKRDTIFNFLLYENRRNNLQLQPKIAL